MRVLCFPAKCEALALIAILLLCGCSKKVTKIEPAPNLDIPAIETEPEREMSPEPAAPEAEPISIHDINFAFDRYAVRPADFMTLQNLAAYLERNPEVNVLIEGHCDTVGSAEYNMGLGDRRSWEAQKYLENYGINPSRITRTSYGEEQPEHADDALNRRDEFKLEGVLK